MSIEPVVRFRRIARIAYSRHPAARWYRLWRWLAAGSTGEIEQDAGDVFVLPLAGLAFSLWLLGTIPGASDAIAAACATACLP
jgi:hypothetical protein